MRDIFNPASSAEVAKNNDIKDLLKGEKIFRRLFDYKMMRRLLVFLNVISVSATAGDVISSYDPTPVPDPIFGATVIPIDIVDSINGKLYLPKPIFYNFWTWSPIMAVQFFLLVGLLRSDKKRRELLDSFKDPNNLEHITRFMKDHDRIIFIKKFADFVDKLGNDLSSLSAQDWEKIRTQIQAEFDANESGQILDQIDGSLVQLQAHSKAVFPNALLTIFTLAIVLNLASDNLLGGIRPGGTMRSSGYPEYITRSASVYSINEYVDNLIDYYVNGGQVPHGQTPEQIKNSYYIGKNQDIPSSTSDGSSGFVDPATPTPPIGVNDSQWGENTDFSQEVGNVYYEQYMPTELQMPMEGYYATALGNSPGDIVQGIRYAYNNRPWPPLAPDTNDLRMRMSLNLYLEFDYNDGLNVAYLPVKINTEEGMGYPSYVYDLRLTYISSDGTELVMQESVHYWLQMDKGGMFRIAFEPTFFQSAGPNPRFHADYGMFRLSGQQLEAARLRVSDSLNSGLNTESNTIDDPIANEVLRLFSQVNNGAPTIDITDQDIVDAANEMGFQGSDIQLIQEIFRSAVYDINKFDSPIPEEFQQFISTVNSDSTLESYCFDTALFTQILYYLRNFITINGEHISFQPSSQTLLMASGFRVREDGKLTVGGRHSFNMAANQQNGLYSFQILDLTPTETSEEPTDATLSYQDAFGLTVVDYSNSPGDSQDESLEPMQTEEILNPEKMQDFFQTLGVSGAFLLGLIMLKVLHKRVTSQSKESEYREYQQQSDKDKILKEFLISEVEEIVFGPQSGGLKTGNIVKLEISKPIKFRRLEFSSSDQFNYRYLRQYLNSKDKFNNAIDSLFDRYQNGVLLEVPTEVEAAGEKKSVTTRYLYAKKELRRHLNSMRFAYSNVYQSMPEQVLGVLSNRGSLDKNHSLIPSTSLKSILDRFNPNLQHIVEEGD